MDWGLGGVRKDVETGATVGDVTEGRGLMEGLVEQGRISHNRFVWEKGHSSRRASTPLQKEVLHLPETRQTDRVSE